MYYWIRKRYQSGFNYTAYICDGKAEANRKYNELCELQKRAYRPESVTVSMVSPAFPWNSKTIKGKDTDPMFWPSIKECTFNANIR